MGSGTNIRINEDLWVPNVPNFRVQLNDQSPEGLVWVNQLILGDPRRWNRELIEQIFDSQIANQILQIPLGQNAQSDLLAWEFDSNGKYSVKIGYRTLWKSQLENKLRTDQELNGVYTTLARHK